MLVITVFLAFFVSALIGQGGGLLMAPIMIATFGPKEGVAMAALLMGANNILKAGAYVRSIPRVALFLAMGTMAGALLGSRLILAVPDQFVLIAVLISMATGFAYEILRREDRPRGGKAIALLFSTLSGITSGVSGTSGPLKAISVRMMKLEPLRHVGGATILSLVGDVTKAISFMAAGLISYDSVIEISWAFALMPLATGAGWYINAHQMTPKWFAALFWMVVGGYFLKLAAAF